MTGGAQEDLPRARPRQALGLQRRTEGAVVLEAHGPFHQFMPLAPPRAGPWARGWGYKGE